MGGCAGCGVGGALPLPELMLGAVSVAAAAAVDVMHVTLDEVDNAGELDADADCGKRSLVRYNIAVKIAAT